MTHDWQDPEDPTAARLRAALNAEAAMTTPSDDGLSNILARTAGARSWWQHPGVLAVAAALVLGMLVGGGFALLGGNGSRTDDGVIANQPTGAPEPSASETVSATPSPTRSGGSDGVYVYYVMDDPVSGPRLYREEHAVASASPGFPVLAALRDMLSAPATDRDYGSPWPVGTEATRYEVTGDTGTVHLTDFPSVGASYEGAAVQQLVYTVTANDKRVKRVRILVNGAAPLSGHQDWTQPVARAPMVDVQGLIWLLSPSEGATVSSPVRIAGYGTAFEGTISWEVRRDGEVVADGFTQGGSMGEFGEFGDTVDLEPGTYELRAFEYSAEDGTPIHIDTKTVTVR